jgi:hypothetical protein
MAASDVHDPAAPEEPPHAASHLPRFEQLLARQAPRTAHGATQPIEQRGPRKPPEIVRGQAIRRCPIERMQFRPSL